MVNTFFPISLWFMDWAPWFLMSDSDNIHWRNNICKNQIIFEINYKQLNVSSFWLIKLNNCFCTWSWCTFPMKYCSLLHYLMLHFTQHSINYTCFLWPNIPINTCIYVHTYTYVASTHRNTHTYVAKDLVYHKV